MFLATPEHCNQKLLLILPPSLVNHGSLGLLLGVYRKGGAALTCEVLRNSADARTKTHKEVYAQRFPGYDVAEVAFRR